MQQSIIAGVGYNGFGFRLPQGPMDKKKPDVRNVMRPEPRLVLAILAGSTGFLLLGLLKGAAIGFNEFVDTVNERRMSVVNRTLSSYGLPFAHMESIRSVPGVAGATFFSSATGEYRDSGELITAVEVANEDYFTVYAAEVLVAPDELEAFGQLETGILAGRALADSYGWRVGDKIDLIGISRLPLEVVGIWDARDASMPSRSVFTHHAPTTNNPLDVLSPQLRWERTNRARVLEYNVLADATQEPLEVADRIDGWFAESHVPTRTRTERQLASTNAYYEVADLDTFANAIVACSLCVLLLGFGAPVARSARDRTRAFAERNAPIGKGVSVTWIVVEALAQALLAAVLGLGAAHLIAPPLFDHLDLAITGLPSATVRLGLAAALLIALASSVLPTIRALHTNATGP